MVNRIPLLHHEIILCSSGIEDFRNGFLSLDKYSSVHVLVDSNTAVHCLPRLQRYLTFKSANIHIVEAGETSKSISTVEQVVGSLHRAGADRSSLLIALGGGMISDLGGFIAGNYMRGIPHIIIPTSLMGMVDASIGGKCAINSSGVKNLLGIFKEPEAVIISAEFISTLPQRELRSGLAEVIKHSILNNEPFDAGAADSKFHDLTYWSSLIESSVRFKCCVVSSDFEDRGVRRQLNFGHTVGHVLEALSQEQDESPLLHGEAVALGMMVETVLSNRLTGLSDGQMVDIIRMIHCHFGSLALPEFSDTWMGLLSGDKKSIAGINKFVLLGKTGEVMTDVSVTVAQLEEAVKALAGILSEKTF